MTDERITSRHDGHWLTFEHSKEYDRHVVTGCYCGFEADVDADCGWGDSVIDHIWNAARLLHHDGYPRIPRPGRPAAGGLRH